MKSLGININSDLSPAVQEVLEEFEASLAVPLSRREVVAETVSVVLWVAAAVALLLLLPADRSVSWHVVVALVAAQAVMTQVKFEVGNGYGLATELSFIPMLLLLPAGWVPLAVLAGAVLGDIPRYARREINVKRSLQTPGDCWYTIGPVLAVGLLAP